MQDGTGKIAVVLKLFCKIDPVGSSIGHLLTSGFAFLCFDLVPSSSLPPFKDCTPGGFRVDQRYGSHLPFLT